MQVCVFAKGKKSLQCDSHERTKKTIDLKTLYDTCEEEKEYKGFRADLILTHSEHPEREPIFLEIAFTHDCEPEKIESGIQIIEIKVEDDNGFSVPLKEQDIINMNLSLPNPYIGELPPVRFFNFNRKKCLPIPLRRFMVLTPKEDGIKRFGILPNEYNITCQDESLQKETIGDYELLAPAEMINDENRFFWLGLAAAANKINIRSCMVCRHHRRGDCYQTIVQEDENGRKSYNRYWTADFSYKHLDRETKASNCQLFSLNLLGISNELIRNRSIPYMEKTKRGER